MGGDSWTECIVDDIKSSVPNALATGPFGSAISARYFVDKGIPVIRGGNLSQDMGIRLIDDGLVFITEEKANEFSRSVAKRGDLVFTCWGTIDQVGLIDTRSRFPEYVVSNKQMKLTPNPQKANSLFLYYLFSSPLMREKILNQGIGSSVPGFNLGQLKSLSLKLPPLPEQRAIAAILGALDDKIELNRRMNRALEEMARALFKSWFVDFDPVRWKIENAKVARGATDASGGKSPAFAPLAPFASFALNPDILALFPDRFEDSAMGEVPEGWRVGQFHDIARNIRRGVQPNTVNPTTPYIGLEHMPRRCIALSEWGYAEELESNKFIFNRGEILFGKLRPYFHKVGIAPADGICSTDILVIAPKENLWFGFVLGHVSSVEFINHADATSTGTRMPRTSWQDMARFDIALPNEQVVAAYNQIISPIVKLIITQIHEARTLAAIRDALLPKLMSGEIQVGEAERFLTQETQKTQETQTG